MIKFCVLVVLLVGFVAAGKINFKDCGKNEVVNLDISDNSGDTVIYHRNKNYKTIADFNANQNSKNITLEVYAVINGNPFKVPDVDPNGCTATKCPLVKGQKFEMIHDGQIQPEVPNGKAFVLVKLTGDNGLLACIQYNSVIEP